MSPRLGTSPSRPASFPRVSGDEPADMWLSVRDALFSRVSGDEPDYVDTLCVARKFSPREWG